MSAPAPTRPESNRNLLYGILALQMDFISRDALIAAMHAWVLAKHKPLGQILREQQALGEDEHALLDALVQKHLQKHGDDAERSLAAVSSIGSARQELERIADADVHASLVHVAARQEDADLGRTTGPAVGTATSSGLRFHILRPHARGGLGEVFVAHDGELHREVALKEIQEPHADDPHSRARFLMEAEITGGLEHPGIVPVYGLGAYADGRPFYAMRFIRGDSLKDAIQRFHDADAASRDPGERALALRKLLGRFLDVCNAIAYAHSRGVLHRDLKPGNVMLGKYGETLVVDWGLAKPLGRDETAATGEEPPLRPTANRDALHTQQGSAVGTPAYMSPEQAAGRLDLLGPASDVYSLGATLYHLLTGRPPFEEREKGLLLQRVQRGEFKPPRAVGAKVAPALEAVCLKAMALRPEHRYATPRELAGDIERWLADEPVSVYREPLMDRLYRFGRRHRPLVAGVGALLVSAVVGLGVGLYFVNAERQRTDAAWKAEEKQRRTAEAARNTARARYQLALDSFNSLVFGIQNKLTDRPATQALRQELLRTAQQGLRKLLDAAEAERGGGDSTLVWAHFQMGDVYQLLGQTQKAKEEYEVAHELALRLAEADPNSADTQRDLSVAQDKLGDVQLEMGDTKGAFRSYRDALDIRKKLTEADPTDTTAQRDLSLAYERLGDVQLRLADTEGALRSYRDALDIRKKLTEVDLSDGTAYRDLSVAQAKLGNAQLEMGDTKGALRSYRDALDIAKKLAEANPTSAIAQRGLAATHERLGRVQLEMGDTEGALQSCRDALDVAKKLAETDLTNAAAQRDVSIAHERLGDVQLRLADTKGALRSYRDALDTRKKLAEANPTNATAQRDLSVAHAKLGNAQLEMGDTEGALRSYRDALDTRKKLAEADPTDATAQRDLAASHSKLGDVQLKMRDTEGALQSYRDSLEIAKKLAEANPTNAAAQGDLALTVVRVGRIHLTRGELAAAREYLEKYERLTGRLATISPENIAFQTDHASGALNMVRLEQSVHDYAAAANWAERGLAILRPLHQSGKIKGQPLYEAWLEDLESQLRFSRAVEKAISDIDFALTKPKEQVPAILDARLRVLAKRGDLDGMVQTAEAIGKSATGDRDQLYNAACAWALCAAAAAKDMKPPEAERSKRATRHADHALDLLRRAAAAGFQDATHMKQDADLEFLRPHEDFRKLLEEMEAKAREGSPKP